MIYRLYNIKFICSAFCFYSLIHSHSNDLINSDNSDCHLRQDLGIQVSWALPPLQLTGVLCTLQTGRGISCTFIACYACTLGLTQKHSTCPSLIDTAYLYYRQDEGSDPVRDAEHQGRDHRAPQCGGGCREASHQVRPGADAGQGNTNYISIQIVV